MSSSRLLVCGSSDWQDEATVQKYLLRLPRDVELRLCGGGVVNEMVLRAANDLGLSALEQDGWGARRTPAARAAFLLAEVRPHAVLAFTDVLFDQRGALTGTGHMIHRSIAEHVRVTVVPSARA